MLKDGQSKAIATNQSPSLFGSATVRRTILVVWFGCTVVAVCVAFVGFRIDNSVGVWFVADDPALNDYREYLNDFGNREWILVVLEPFESNSAEAIRDRDELISRFELLEHVHWVLSVSDFREESDFVSRFLKPDPESSREALLLHITNDIERQDGYRETLVTELRMLAETFPSISSVRIAGTAVINGELNRAARRDMFLFFPTVALFVGLLGWLMFRNLRDTIVLLGVSLSTVAITEGLLVGMNYPLNMITIMLPTVLIALSVADVVHLIHVFHSANLRFESRAFAAMQAVKSIAAPCAGTTLTTIAGFLAFSGSSVLPVFQLSILASFGIALAWVLTVTCAPALLVVLWEGKTREVPASVRVADRVLRWWAQLVERYPRRIVAGFALGCFVLVGLPSLRADTDYVKFFRANSRVPTDYTVLQSEGFPQNPLSLVFRVPPGKTITSQQYWTPLKSFSRQLQTLPGVQAVLSPYVMSDLVQFRCEYAATLGGMQSQNADQVQLVVMMDYPSSQRLFALLPEIRALAKAILPADLSLMPTGTSYLWARMDDGVIQTQRESLAIVCIVCLVLLVILFRSFRLAIIGLALSLYPVAMVLGLMGLLGIPVNLATVLIAGITVGLAVDDTIHFVHAYQKARLNDRDRKSACSDAVIVVGMRMVTTSLILIGSFVFMGFSNFTPTSQFGLLTSLTIGLALLADLTLLPVLLSSDRTGARDIQSTPDLSTARIHEPAISTPVKSKRR